MSEEIPATDEPGHVKVYLCRSDVEFPDFELREELDFAGG